MSRIMSIKHLTGRTKKELINTVPIWQRREIWHSPWVVFVLIGYAIYGIIYFIGWIFKWIIFSWFAPFSNNMLFCKMGFHKYRELEENQYTCIICNNVKEKIDYC